MISVLCPTRGRPTRLIRSIASIRGLAAGPIEILAMADPDDEPTQTAIKDLGLPLHVASQRYGYGRLSEYYNQLAAAAAGDWLLLWNDDALMETPSWDQRIIELPAHVLVAFPGSNHGTDLNTFPAVRRWAVDTVGHFSLSVHADTWWQDIGHGLDAQQRIDVFIRHERDDLIGAQRDQTRQDALHSYRRHDYWTPEMIALRQADINTLRRATVHE